MKPLLKITLLLLFLSSCTSSYQKAIASDTDQYSILNQKELMVVKAPYAVLRKEPSLESSTLFLLRKNTILRVLSHKQTETQTPQTTSQWYYVQSIMNTEEKGWTLPWESQIAPNIYNAQHLANTPKD